MKKLLLLPLFLFSCTSREDVINKYSKEILDSALQNVFKGRTIVNQWDSTITRLQLTQLEEMDSNYVRLCNNYENIKVEIAKIDTSEIIKRYNYKKSIHCDTGLIYSESFDKQIEELELEYIRSYYLLLRKKEALIEKRSNDGKDSID